ncbi:hypothetical protein JCM11491_001116 [Sporobolomyces phaffii]
MSYSPRVQISPAASPIRRGVSTGGGSSGGGGGYENQRHIIPSATSYSGTGPGSMSQVERERRKRKRTILIGLCGLLVLALLCVTIIPPAVVVTRNKNSKSNLEDRQGVVTTVIDGKTEVITKDGVTRVSDIVVIASATRFVTGVETLTFTALGGIQSVATVTLTDLEVVTVIGSVGGFDDESNHDRSEYDLIRKLDFGQLLIIYWQQLQLVGNPDIGAESNKRDSQFDRRCHLGFRLDIVSTRYHIYYTNDSIIRNRVAIRQSKPKSRNESQWLGLDLARIFRRAVFIAVELFSEYEFDDKDDFLRRDRKPECQPDCILESDCDQSVAAFDLEFNLGGLDWLDKFDLAINRDLVQLLHFLDIFLFEPFQLYRDNANLYLVDEFGAVFIRVLEPRRIHVGRERSDDAEFLYFAFVLLSTATLPGTN